MTKPNYQPSQYHSITPYLMFHDAARAIDWYKKVFGAEEIMRMPMPDGKIGHAELRIQDSMIMLADEQQHWKSPKTLGGTAVAMHLYVKDVDAVFKNALANGATETRPVENQFYGDRLGALVDPFGHMWSIGTHIEDVSPEEMQKRMAAMPQKS